MKILMWCSLVRKTVISELIKKNDAKLDGHSTIQKFTSKCSNLITQEKLHIVPYLLDKAGTRARQCCTIDDKKEEVGGIMLRISLSMIHIFIHIMHFISEKHVMVVEMVVEKWR